MGFIRIRISDFYRYWYGTTCEQGKSVLTTVYIFTYLRSQYLIDLTSVAEPSHFDGFGSDLKKEKNLFCGQNFKGFLHHFRPEP